MNTNAALSADLLPETAKYPTLLERYRRVRSRTESLVAPLSPEDMVVQSMPDASPAKWHLAHTAWFFETFLLLPHVENYRPYDPEFAYLFNSYYEALGQRQPRAQRGMMTRPAVKSIIAYRHHVDERMVALLQSALPANIADLVELGIAHEEQHQELLLMDLLHLFSLSPVKPVYDRTWPDIKPGRRGRFIAINGGTVDIGTAAKDFAFDNEGPRHTVWLHAFEISDHLVTNAEWLEFIADGGYSRHELWLSDGWSLVQAEAWQAPLYWEQDSSSGEWRQMSLKGLQAIQPDAPVSHISYYEAAAFAAWAGARLPSEAEWEYAASAGILEQVDDAAWQWTQSAYGAYPGFRPAASAVGEYNGKFMVNQMVLRGGADITPAGHSRLTYRNFYRPGQRWMRAGLRLARDARAHNATIEMDAEFAGDVVAGLSAKKKNLSPKYFYDATGSELFEEICLTPEYYPTRTETALLQHIAAEIAADLPAGAVLVEFGSGASDKTRLILDAAPHIASYVPIDISKDALEKAAAKLAQLYPALQVLPLLGDFTATLALPAATQTQAKVGFFPGSTIGNFTPEQAVQFLRAARQLMGDKASLLVGADVVKDEATLVAAYDDAAGVTARFNKNMLVRINRELGGNFDLDMFDHKAIWNNEHQRMEMHLVSKADQLVNAAGHTFAFMAGETFHTENSHKFTPESFARLAAQAGWSVRKQWISEVPQFAVFSLVPEQTR
ncbi:hypothetical protein GCM10011396_41640 [Undibacterium terreum]|uniref:Dimethylhistidine N-methyltransferase n=2 Tax=Undibacterium terreum TaxID=1224302 RepID=A0A916XNJ8_9BURK|nr:hypothetical protein GCM10011396_41640 [Undibacterium terreum]